MGMVECKRSVEEHIRNGAKSKMVGKIEQNLNLLKGHDSCFYL